MSKLETTLVLKIRRNYVHSIPLFKLEPLRQGFVQSKDMVTRWKLQPFKRTLSYRQRWKLEVGLDRLDESKGLGKGCAYAVVGWVLWLVF